MIKPNEVNLDVYPSDDDPDSYVGDVLISVGRHKRVIVHEAPHPFKSPEAVERNLRRWLDTSDATETIACEVDLLVGTGPVRRTRKVS